MEYHGGNIYEHNESVIDFSSNINPLGVPQCFKHALFESIRDFSVYPDREYMKLRQNVARYIGNISVDNIIPGNGAVDIIYRALEAMEYSNLYISRPTFSEYKRAGEKAKMEVQEIDIYKPEYEGVNLESLIESIKEQSVVLLCNPNNPTGTLIEKSEFLELLKNLQKTKSFLIIDEAFIEFAPKFKDASMVEYIRQYDNLLIIRAATKFFGMPGIRLGYGITSNVELIKSIERNMEPWSVNTAAEIAASCIFDDKEYINATLDWIQSERSYLYEKLIEINGLKVYKSNSNFLFLKLLDEKIDAYELQKKLFEYNILIRLPKGFNGVSRYNFRIAIKDRINNDVLISSLKDILETNNTQVTLL
ncbi:aminotransferase class I/II-fold pyridoxal phosphate-dependent enzyme [Clostridium sp. YIM B02505]|uniref:Aminotransferase class I/II-fold pyridoxal phosphate-dependent enzyme n=1 Tax=Clostridium yunnanense TaxID=2800325 RepID=A0ABS1EJ67_9CLOT|nr:aminotransferase class I/II-fold pyridoxal phosphate-dependent enzyme [Clostridium yunnanense]